MFAKWCKEYQRLSQKTRFLSQLAAFLVSIFSFLSLYELARFFYYEPQFLKGLMENEETQFWSSIIFQIAILMAFALRFSLLFFKTSKSFWLSQGLCFIGMILLASYWLVSRPPDDYYKFFPNEWVIFKHASQSLQLYGLYYLLLSPIRQLITFIVSLINQRSRI